MKKLMMVAAAALVAGASHAALINWGNAPTSKLVGLDGTTAITAANATAWGLTLSLMYADGTATGSSVSTMSMSAGVLAGTAASWTYNYGTDAQNGDEFYIKALMTVDGTTYEMNIYADQATQENFVLDLGANPNNTSTATFSWKAGTYGGTMWSAQSVPEPTSGLLLLMGMAGLALKRKRV